MDFYIDYFVRASNDDPETIRAYAVIDAYARRAGHPLGDNDAWIAATAAVTGARLLTTDKDFDRLDPMFLRREWINPDID
jgi:tRNA(fMet)-specific endonuclease VapC